MQIKTPDLLTERQERQGVEVGTQLSRKVKTGISSTHSVFNLKHISSFLYFNFLIFEMRIINLAACFRALI